MKKILLLALGGEGGGTLTEWIVQAGIASKFPIQATSIPGVAQRTGATSYYIECWPHVLAHHEQAPPMCLAPSAGELDLILSSELLETARAIERGMSRASQTQVITSDARVLTVDERTHGADGRANSEALIASVKAQTKSLSVISMTALARQESTVVSAVMFGVFAASGVLPLSRELCESVIRGESSALDQRTLNSLRGFVAGYQAVAKPSVSALNQPIQQPSLALETVLQHAKARLTDYQDTDYADLYLQRVEAIRKADQSPFIITTEAARTLALWMSYEDIIRVADLKSRPSRFAEIRKDYGAKPHEPIVVRDFLKPGFEEIAAVLPPSLSASLLAWAKRNNKTTIGNGMQLKTSHMSGLFMMRCLAKLRFLRRKSSRFIEEQALIERWHKAMIKSLTIGSSSEQSLEFASLIATMPSLIRGYSDTFARGRAHFNSILETLVEPQLHSRSSDQIGSALLKLRKAIDLAQSHTDDQQLFATLGISQPPPKEHPIIFAKPITRKKTLDHAAD